MEEWKALPPGYRFGSGNPKAPGHTRELHSSAFHIDLRRSWSQKPPNRPLISQKVLTSSQKVDWCKFMVNTHHASRVNISITSTSSLHD